MHLIVKSSLIIVLLFLLSSCSQKEEPTPTSTTTPPPTATATATSTMTPVPTDTPTLTPTPEPTATPGPLSAEEIFNEIGPSVVFIETKSATGSGLLFDQGYIVTNAHVIWPYEEVRVVFPDGTEHEKVPVVNWDLLGDLAILGPIESEADPLVFADGEDLSIGSEVYLIGYPGEVEEFPKPTITRGLISRVREWEPAEITFFQTDATIVGGQSGGVMVTEYGDVIGISGLSFGDAEFGLVASAADLEDRIDRLIDGEDISGLGNRGIPTVGGQNSHDFVGLEHEWDSEVFVLYVQEGTDIDIEVESDSVDLGLVVLDVAGYLTLHADEGLVGKESGSFTTDIDAPYFVNLYSFSPYPEMASISANRHLIPFVDLDDNRGLVGFQTKLGSLDFPGDIDHFNLVLDEGEKINIHVDSIMFDPLLVIARPGDRDEQIVADDDTGGGIFGLNSELTYIAPDSGSYLLIVQDALGFNVGGYTIQIREPYDGGPTPMAPMPTRFPTFSGDGSMMVYESPYGPFSIEVPANWSDNPGDLGQFSDFCQMATACFVGESLLAIAEEDLSILDNLTVDEYADLYLTTTEIFGTELLSYEEFTTSSGLTAVVVTVDFGGVLRAKRFMYVHDDLAFNATYLLSDDDSEEFLQMIDASFSSFDVH